jgi:hypothetical protein
MDYRIFAGYLAAFIKQQEELSALWNGDSDGIVADNAQTASHLIELAQPLLDELEALIANEDFVPPQK